MSAFNPSQPFAEDFADIRSEAVASLKYTQGKRAATEQLIAETKAKLKELEALATDFRATEDGFVNTLARMERWARGDFDDLQPDSPNE